MDDLEPTLRRLLSKYIGGRRIESQTPLNVGLGLDGDDAAEFLDEVHQRFGTSLSGFRFDA